MKSYPALDIRSTETELLFAALDDFAPTAIEEREDRIRAFFRAPSARDAALGALTPQFDATAIDIVDEDWARRSQESLTPIVVGRITIEPPWCARRSRGRGRSSPEIAIVIEPSMGFGTGQHVTTRLCLEALQQLDLVDRSVLDVGTGSGILAIAAARLGATRVVAIDTDPDAIQSARRNLRLNRSVRRVSFEVADVTGALLPQVDVITANLTGALLVRLAPALLAATRPDGCLVLSGLLAAERDQAREAFASAALLWERREDEWVGLTLKRS